MIGAVRTGISIGVPAACRVKMKSKPLRALRLDSVPQVRPNRYRARYSGFRGGLLELKQHFPPSRNATKSSRSPSDKVVRYAGMAGPPFRIFSVTVALFTGTPESNLPRF